MRGKKQGPVPAPKQLQLILDANAYKSDAYILADEHESAGGQ
jgi:hypothetical protein